MVFGVRLLKSHLPKGQRVINGSLVVIRVGDPKAWRRFTQGNSKYLGFACDHTTHTAGKSTRLTIQECSCSDGSRDIDGYFKYHDHYYCSQCKHEWIQGMTWAGYSRDPQPIMWAEKVSKSKKETALGGLTHELENP